MLASVDGRIVTDDWPLSDEERRQYEQVHATYGADGWLCGRVTMQRHFAAGARPDTEVAREYDGPRREDFVAAGVHESFAVALDPRGRLVCSTRTARDSRRGGSRSRRWSGARGTSSGCATG